MQCVFSWVKTNTQRQGWSTAPQAPAQGALEVALRKEAGREAIATLTASMVPTINIHPPQAIHAQPPFRGLLGFPRGRSLQDKVSGVIGQSSDRPFFGLAAHFLGGWPGHTLGKGL